MNDRLTKPEWLKHGLSMLAREGPGALKVGPLADKLGVSRGSFYWHFRNIEDFRSQLLQRWQEISTDQVIDELDARPDDPDRLKDLLRSAFGGQRKLDRAVRSWAAQDRKVAIAVAVVDEKRIARLSRLLAEAGVAREVADHRAVFLYWAFLGQASVMDQRHASIPELALADIASLLESPASRVA